MIARVLTLLLGLAIAGTSVWEPRGSEVATPDVSVGLLIAAASVVAVAVRGANYLCTALGLWLFFSGMVYPVVPHIDIGIVGGTLVFSVGHPAFYFGSSPSGRYLDCELVEEPWPSFGVVMKCWRRPFEEVLAPAIEAGLAIDRVLEPRPSAELRARDSGRAAKLDSAPAFICVRAVKPADLPATRGAGNGA